LPREPSPTSDEPAYIRNFKTYTQSDPTLEDLKSLEEEMFGANDRAVAIMLGAFMETALTKFIRIRFRQDLNSDERRAVYDYDGPLGTFAAKIAIAYAMATIGPLTRDDLDLIRIIRNGFAHSRKSIKFDDTETVVICAKLQTPDLEDAKTPVKGYAMVLEPDWLAHSDRTKPQIRYRIAVHTISAKMLKVRSRYEMAHLLKPLTTSDLP